MVRVAVYAMFMVSGATALVYEVAWTRSLVLLLGGTQYAVSLILAAWMLGLALGAGLMGRRADRTRRPLLLYGLLEAGIAALAFLFPVLLGLARDLSLAAGGSRAVAFLAGFGVLLLPTTLMGATLPVLSRFVVRRLGSMGGRLGLLYGLNTFGAVLGTFLAGFFLIRLLGVFGSTYAAAVANLLIAVAAVLLGLRESAGARAEPPKLPPLPEDARSTVLPIASIAFMSGLIALGSEVLWTRMLTFFLEGFTYTFSAMLTTFLLGLSAGALLSGFLVDRIRDLRKYVGWLFSIGALVSAGVLYTLTNHFEVTNWAKDLTEGIFANWRVHHAASLFVASFVVLFPPALVMGGIFPAVARMATRHEGEVGRRVGLVYAVNTAGSVAGALLAGLVFARVFGMAWGAATLAFLGAGVGLVLIRPWRSLRCALVAVPLAAGVVGFVLFAGPGKPFVLNSHVFKGTRGLEWELLSYEEGIYGAISVLESPRNRTKAIYTDEFQAAATGPQYKYMRMLAHLPLLLAPKWEGSEVLVICFGTGTTAGSAAAHPIGRLDIVEIAQEVLDQAHRFRDVNKGILEEDPSRTFPVNVHVDDGRNYLLRADRTWDVITLEPLMPYTPAAVSFYTKDFYELCREKLSEGGVACQWIPIHAMSHDDYKMLIRSFVEVFPNSSLWFVEGTSLIIGTRDPLPLSYGRVVTRLAAEGVSSDLGGISFDDERLILNTYVTSGEDLLEFVADAFVMTDEHPLMEFRPLPYKFPNSFLADNLALLSQARKPVAEHLDLSMVPEGGRQPLRDSFARFYRGGQAFLEAESHKAASAYFGAIGDMKKQEQHYKFALAAYDAAVREVPEDASARYLRRNAMYGWWISLGILELERGNYDAATRHLERAKELENPFKSDMAFALLGKTKNRQGRHREALGLVEEALRRFPKSPEALAERGFARFELGRAKEAIRDFHAAFDGGVPPEADAALLAARKRAYQMERKGLVPDGPSADADPIEILDKLRDPGTAATAPLMEELLAVHKEAPERVRSALAADMERSRDPEASSKKQEFALDILVALGDLDGTLDLLRTGAPTVREKAADYLALVKHKPVIPALIEAMEDRDRRVREAAWAALFGLTGRQAQGYAPDAPEDARRKALESLREWWKKVEPDWTF